MRPQSRLNLTTGLVSAAVAAILALGSLAAAAGAVVPSNKLPEPNPGPPATSEPDGPQTANIPYVAWAGEHVRLVVCDEKISAPEGSPAEYANFAVEDWSGYQFQPPTPDGAAGTTLGQEFNPGPAAFFTSSEPAHEINEKPDGCVATDYKSLNPGLSRIRVVIRNQETHEVVFSHQFLVIWLKQASVALHEASLTGEPGGEVFQSQLSTRGKELLKLYLGDPTGSGEFTPTPFEYFEPYNAEFGFVQIKVTGSFPVEEESPLWEYLKKTTYTLPTEWVALADQLASASEEKEPPGSDPMLWDIHGTPKEATATEGNGTNEGFLLSKFTRVFGDLTSGTNATVGPFEPQAANETLLSDGRLNENDAPMPALRIDLSIAKNEGGSDLGGVGQISGFNGFKALLYSHELNGASTPLHNLYNPYYGAYIPATDRPVAEASGVTGSSPGGDFPGFVNKHPEPYGFWEELAPRDERTSHSTGCLRREGLRPPDYATPGGDLTKTFYTDEEGEAYAYYTPGDQFYLEDLPKLKAGESDEGKVENPNEDGGCDLKGVYEHVIGESLISAKGIYPYEPVDYSPLQSNTLVKKVKSKWEKTWFTFKKGLDGEYESVRIIVAKAQDIDGGPIQGEKVCFSVGGFGGAVAYTKILKDPGERVFPGSGRKELNLAGTTPEEFRGINQLCLHTNYAGLAAIELDNGSFAGADLPVDFVEEGIIRDHEVEAVPPKEAPKEESKAKTESTTTPTTTPATTSTPTTTALVTPLATTPAVGNSGVAGLTVSKPLTANQKLHKALNACKKKKPKKKRLSCEAQARKAFGAKAKPKPPAPKVIGLG